MNIVFLIFLDNPDLMDGLTLDETVAVHHVYEYVESRLNVLKEQIEHEESTGLPKQIIICFEKGVAFKNYSEPLRVKMKGCFPETSNGFLTTEINEKIARLLS